MKLILWATAALVLLAGTADATEYEFRLLDPLPEDFLRFEGNNTTEPETPSQFGPSARGELGGNATKIIQIPSGPIFASRGLRWNSAGELSELEPENPSNNPFAGSIAYGMNKFGDIAGRHSDGIQGGAAIWHSDGSRTDLPSLDDSFRSSQQTFAFGINDRGVVVGQSTIVFDPDVVSEILLPVVWDKFGQIAELPVPEDTERGAAWSINDAGLIFGRIAISLDPLELITVIWCPRRCR